MFENSDDYDFNPAESSKLASLFGSSALSGDSLNSSLKYTAPKQPISKANEPSKPTTPTTKLQTTILLTKVVFVWKHEDKAYKALGKHGLAIIGSEDLKIYEIIVYKEKTNVILKTKVSSDFQFHMQKDNFSSFYDTDSKNWLVKFENEDQREFNSVIEKCGARIVTSKEQYSEKKSEASKPDLLPKPSVNPEAEDQNSDSSDSHKRSNILNRMAKMGQQILPRPRQVGRNTSTDISDTELEDNVTGRKLTRKPKHTVSEKTWQKTPLDVERRVSEYTPVVYTPSAQSVNPDIFGHYMMSQNAELKMHLSQMTAKLDAVLMGRPVHSVASDSVAQGKIKALQLKLENLEAYLKEYEKKYMRLEIKYEELCEKKEDKYTVKKLEKESLDLRKRILELEKQLEEFEGTKEALESCKKCVEINERLIEEQKQKLKNYEDHDIANKNQEATINSLHKTVDDLSQKLMETKEVNQEMTKQKSEQMSSTIKVNMNDMYASILDNLDRDKTYSYADIQSTIAKFLKTTTFKIIDDLNGIVSSRKSEP